MISKRCTVATAADGELNSNSVATTYKSEGQIPGENLKDQPKGPIWAGQHNTGAHGPRQTETPFARSGGQT